LRTRGSSPSPAAGQLQTEYRSDRDRLALDDVLRDTWAAPLAAATSPEELELEREMEYFVDPEGCQHGV
jgi:hypothetical protein